MFIEQSPLRKHLQEITEKDASEHKSQLEALRLKIPHSIEVVLFEEREGLQISDFMCYEYAFGLFDFGEYREALENQRRWKINIIGANDKFVIFLITDNSIEEIQIENVKYGDLIIYFENSHPTHAGIIINNRVKSKWGNGLIFEHEINEVPALFGNNVRFFKYISPGECFELFYSYASTLDI